MYNGKMKAVTFSYDDGVKQDVRLIEILDKYGLKATFNINSGLLGNNHILSTNDWSVDHSEIPSDLLKDTYKNHEIAVHTLTHPNLTKLDENEIIKQIEEDRMNLENLAGYDVVGMAYPCGGENNNEFVANIIKNKTKIKYARTITSTYNFDKQNDLYRFNPTVYHVEFDEMFKLANEFIGLKPENNKIFYIWGHSYELDIYNSWDKFEEFCKLISNKDDIYYGTNKQILIN